MSSPIKFTFIITAIYFLKFELCFCSCEQAEYEMNGECCPLCGPGTHVYMHCTNSTSTRCMPCVDSYTDEHNSLSTCKTCTVCDAGLKVKSACTRNSDTVCEPLEGFYCIGENMSNCTQAVEHTKCKPGQYIMQKGTAVKDAECAVCPDGTYSSGSLQICRQHTKCQDEGLEEITPGTSSADVTCGRKAPINQIIGPIILLVFIILVLAEALISQTRPFFRQFAQAQAEYPGKFQVNEMGINLLLQLRPTEHTKL